jgi:hypothetical protein
MQQRNRINGTWAAIFYTVAFILDIAGLILGLLGVNFIASIISFVILAGLFFIRGASYTKKPARLIKSVVVMVFGAIPIIGALPVEQLVGVFLNIRDVRREDMLFNAQQQALLEQEQREQEARIRKAMWMRQQRGWSDGSEEEVYEDEEEVKNYRIADYQQNNSQTTPQRSNSFVRSAAIKGVSIIQPEIGAAIKVANKVQTAKNLGARKDSSGYNRAA